MIAFIVGAMVGGTVGLLTAALLNAADDEPAQLPTLGPGTWLVGIDRHGELVRCESHHCLHVAFDALDAVMRSDEA